MLSTTNLSIALLMATLTSGTKLEHTTTLAQLMACAEEVDMSSSHCNGCCCCADKEPEPVEPEPVFPPEPEPEVPEHVPDLEPDETLDDIFSSADGKPVVLDF